jgi:hypothetical protein
MIKLRWGHTVDIQMFQENFDKQLDIREYGCVSVVDFCVRLPHIFETDNNFGKPMLFSAWSAEYEGRFLMQKSEIASKP